MRNLPLTRFHQYCSVFLLLAASSLNLAAYGATINIGCSTSELVNAVVTANGNSEDDLINLASDCEYILTAANNSTLKDGANGLPIISTSIMINGNDNAIVRAEGAPRFRFFEIAATGSLTLRNITLKNGWSSDGVIGQAPTGSFFTGTAPGGGAILAIGELALDNTKILNNKTGAGANETNASGGSGGAIGAYGTDDVTIFASLIQGNQTGPAVDPGGTPGGGGAFDIENNSFVIDASAVVENKVANTLPGCCNGFFPYIALLFQDDSFVSTRTTYSGNGPLDEGFLTYSPGFFANGSAPIEFSNNTFVNNRNELIRIDAAQDDGLIIRNNLFEANDQNCIVTASALNVPLSHNNLFDDGSNNCGLTNGVNGNLTNITAGVEPLAYNGGATPSHNLSANSPARDRYDYDALTFKYDQRIAVEYGNDGGTARYGEDTSVDIGAIEAIDVTPIAKSTTTTNNELAQFGRQQDWYSVKLEKDDELGIFVNFTHSIGDVDLKLFSKDNFQEYAAISESESDNESIVGSATENAEFWFVVYGFSAAENNYDLEVQITRNGQQCFPVVAANNNISVVCL